MILTRRNPSRVAIARHLALAAALLVTLFLLAGCGPKTDPDIDRVQGSWDLIAVCNEGSNTMLSDVPGASGVLKIEGTEFSIDLVVASSTTNVSGTVAFSDKVTSDDGTDMYLYDFLTEGETIIGVYVPDNGMITISTTGDEFDIDNTMTFMK